MAQQQILVLPSYVAILLLAITISLVTVIYLWKKAETVEAMLVINALLQIVIIIILLSK